MKLIAHGGYSAAYPENTLESFLEAAKYKPFAIEMDVIEHPETGELVCFHPQGLSSAAGTYDSVQVGKQVSSADELPRLHDVLPQIQSDTYFLLDFKQPSKSAFLKLLEDPTIDKERIIIGVRNMEDFSFIKKYDPRAQTLALFSNPDDYATYAKQGGKYFRIWEKDATTDRVKLAKELGLEVWITPGQKAKENQPRTAGEVDEIKLQWLVNMYVDGILVNDIKLASSYMKRKQ